MSQLGLGLGLSNVSSLLRFSPLDLDPYLLFDTQSSMIGTFENPTLDLDPSVPSTLDVITATRAGVATYTDADGLIQSASADTVRVDYTQGAELTPTKYQHIGYTDFSSGRVLSNFGTGVTPVLSSDALGSPNGTEDAYKIVFNSGSGTTSGNGSELYFNASEIEDNIQSTASIYLRGENGGEQLIFRGASNGSYQLVTLTTEWQRFTTTESTSPSGNQKFTFGIRQSVSGHGVINSAATIYAYGPQLEEGTTASPFVANTTLSPKFITGATYGPRVPMMLVEPSATNLIPYSEDFSNSAWSKNNMTLSSGFSAPDGSMNASKLEANAADSSLQYTFTVTSGTTYSVSFYLKTISGSLETAIGLGSPGFPQNEGEGGRYKNITVTDEWQRFTLTSTADASAATGISFGGFSSFSTGEEVYIWGAQLEAGSVATSIIPTSGGDAAARTRAADNLEITGSDFTNFFNSSEGTFYVETQIKQPEKQYSVLRGGGNSQLYIYTNADVAHHCYDGASVTTFGNVTANQLSRFALSYKSNSVTASLDGSENTNTHSGNLGLSTKLEIGTGYTLNFNGHFRRLLFWPYHSDSL